MLIFTTGDARLVGSWSSCGEVDGHKIGCCITVASCRTSCIQYIVQCVAWPSLVLLVSCRRRRQGTIITSSRLMIWQRNCDHVNTTQLAFIYRKIVQKQIRLLKNNNQRHNKHAVNKRPLCIWLLKLESRHIQSQFTSNERSTSICKLCRHIFCKLLVVFIRLKKTNKNHQILFIWIRWLRFDSIDVSIRD